MATTAAVPLPSIGLAPAGAWTGLKWVSAGTAFPQTPVPAADSGSVQVSVFGWSGGYVGFRTAYDISLPTTEPSVAMVSTSSTDGVHWLAGRPMEFKGLKDVVFVTQVLEGPSGLLAVGHYGRAACGGPETVDALWTSPDGQIWTLVTPPADFDSASVYTVDGGSVGFIASGTLKDGATQAIWLSTDGRSWRRAAVPMPTTGTLFVNGATGFKSGYVVAGAVLGDEGCGGPRLLTPSLWWSDTGTGWTRVKLTGATPADDATMAVTRISDHAVMAVATEWSGQAGPTQIVWVSTNGQDWRLVQSPSSLLGGVVVTDGRRGLVAAEPPDGTDARTIATVGDDLTVTTLAQTGDIPGASSSSTAGWMYALGPSGVVCVTSDGSSLWLGIPAGS